MKTCRTCNESFNETNITGHEQLYCSKSCRYKAGNIRRIEKIRNDIKKDIYNDNNDNNENNGIESVKCNELYSNYYDKYEIDKMFMLQGEVINKLIEINHKEITIIEKLKKEIYA